MKILGFNSISNVMRLEPESFDDLYLLAVIINHGDEVEGKSTRRFRPSEGDKGEQKDIRVKIAVEKAEIDRSAFRLRVSGKIMDGSPLEFISMGSYHPYVLLLSLIPFAWPEPAGALPLYLISLVYNHCK